MVRLVGLVELVHRHAVVAFDRKAAVLRVGRVREKARQAENERFAFVASAPLQSVVSKCKE